MANKPRFVSSLGSINKYFADTKKNVFSYSELVGVLESKRVQWALPQSMYPDKFINQLINKANFKEVEVAFEGLGSKTVYTINEPAITEIAASLFLKSYLSHYSAVNILGLTEQIPKTVYITQEQSKKPLASIEISRRSLTQESIDAAFKKPQRVSDIRALLNGYELVLLKGKNTSNAGVRSIGEGGAVRITDVERTLIDIAVRPSYSGGVFEALKAYRIANQLGNVSINKLLGYLNKMDFIYPYHQAIGFYLERAGGYKESQIQKFRDIKKELKFYLAYDMREMDYSEEWKLFVPKGL
ncbi:MAG: hypothetical protein EOO43_02905 [Flavobacterium sp.]|nr:MAG: hypothetical protein EOO43_02905 [Flavobacterium sp.]